MKKRAFVAISVALICGLVFVGCPKPKITELEGLWNGDGALTSNWAFAENKVEYNMGLSVTVLTYTIAVNQKYTGTFTLDTAQTPKWIDLSFTDMEYTWTFSIGNPAIEATVNAAMEQLEAAAEALFLTQIFQPRLGVYQLTGNTMLLTVGAAGEPRPALDTEGIVYTLQAAE